MDQRREMKHKGRNVVWSVAMDKCLIEALAIQARNGNKIDKCFNDNAYTAACMAVNSRFSLDLNNQKVVNRLKTIKKRYKVIRDVLNQDGFRWNPSTRMIDCDSEELWKRYIVAHPDARGIKGKKIDMYDELNIVCGNYQVPCRWDQMRNFGHESASFMSPSAEDASDDDGTESYTGSEDNMQDGGQDPPPPPPLIQPGKQLPKQPHGGDALQEAMLAVASSIRRLADAVEQSKTTPLDTTQLLQAVMEIDGLEEGKQMYAFEYLNADPVKARAFMTYDLRMRKMYLFRQFWWWR